MRKKILICVLLMLTANCDGHPPSLLGGLVSGVHDLGSKVVHNVIGGLTQGALNLEGHLEANHAQTGYHDHSSPGQIPNNGGYRPGKPTETIIVIVETDGHHHHGHPGQRPPPPGYGPHSHYNQQNNGQWSNNNYNKPQNTRPGYGYNPQDPNFNGSPYHNNGNFNQNNYGNTPNNDNFNQNYETKPPNYNYGVNNFGQPPANTPNFNQNNQDANPNQNSGQNYEAKPPTFISGNTQNQNQFGSIPNSPPPPPPFLNPQDGVQNQNKPTSDLPTSPPEKNPQYGSIYDVNKENANNIPTRKPETNVGNNDHTTKKPDDDLPLFVPLNPNQYHYGGDKIEVNAPKRETNEKPAEDDSESYPIDIRFGDD